ncbi:hypothetical protein SNE40_006942 [Patella caerulea]|uniref:Nuclear pore complex protein Nup88 n=1 Tax=Patella caerulea TaxID=87958 RepID=A0AAN8K4W3_PATCE
MAAYSGWRSRLNNHQFCKQLRENNVKESRFKLASDAKQLIAVIDGDIYVWDASATHLIYFHLKTLLNVADVKNETYRHQTLLCLEPPRFEVESIKCNTSVSHVAIWGADGIRVMVLPRRWGKFAEYEGGKNVISCRVISVAERYCIGQAGVKVQQVSWHPGSKTDSHLAMLTSDNMLSTFDIANPDKACHVINMDTIHTGLNISPNKLSFSAALGEKTVAFDFGEPFQLQQKRKVLGLQAEEEETTAWPIYLVKGNGNIYVTYCNLSTERELNLPVQGPLIMYPPADDNYGIDACDIMCLNSTPPVLVVVTCEGKLHHCLVLQADDNNSNSTIQFEQSSKLSCDSMFYEPITEPNLYVIESVELELSLTTAQHDSNQLIEDDFTCPVKLQKDPSTYDRYHCSHAAGVHTVALPWAHSLNTFASDDDEINPVLPENQDCIVEHVICTKPLTSSVPSPIQGLSVVTDPSLGVTLLVLSSDYQFTALPLSSKYRTVSAVLASDSESRGVKSPLRRLSQEPFDYHISKILQRTSSNPLLKSGYGTEVSQQECFQLLSRATQVLREEYIQKQDQARVEIETRAKILTDQKRLQNEDLKRLEESRNILRDQAETIAEKLETCQHSQELILKRLQVIMRKIQSRLPMLSDAEKNYDKELQTMSDNIDGIKKNLEQLKKKQEYQKRQMSFGNNTAVSSPVLKKNQTTKLKEILQQESDEISELMKKVNQLKVDTSISLS